MRGAWSGQKHTGGRAILKVVAVESELSSGLYVSVTVKYPQMHTTME